MLTVHHLQVSQSERVVWACEELDIPYTLTLHQRDPLFSPDSIKKLHPLEAAPIIQDGSLTLAESAACVDYINHVHGGSRLALPPTHKNYADYLYWFHFANGSLQPYMGRLMLIKMSGVDPESGYAKRQGEKMQQYLKFADDRLGEKGVVWFAGEEFTAADVMMVFTLTTMRTFVALDLSAYGNILAYLKRIGERDGFKRARAKADPELEYYCQGPSPEPFADQLKKKGKI